jgi:hypothetical protein
MPTSNASLQQASRVNDPTRERGGLSLVVNADTLSTVGPGCLTLASREAISPVRSACGAWPPEIWSKPWCLRRSKTAGEHVGRVAVQASVSLRVGKIVGINAKYCQVLQRADRYEDV